MFVPTCFPARHALSRLTGLCLLFLLTALPLTAHGDPADFDMDKMFKGDAHISDSKDIVNRYGDQDVAVIDMHMHSGSFDNMGPLGQAFVLNAIPLPLPDDVKRNLARVIADLTRHPFTPFVGIRNECRKAGLSAAVLFSVYTPEAWGVEDNATVIGHLDDSRNFYRGQPFFYGFASISQVNWAENEQAALAELDRALSHPKMVGVKLAFAHNVEPLDNPAFDSIYQLAERHDAPVYHHIGSSPLRRFDDFPDEAGRQRYFRSFHPQFVEGAVQRFPRVRFILGHMGFDFNDEDVDGVDEVFRLARTYPNVYLEISAFGSDSHDPDGSVMDDILGKAKEYGLIDRVIYGSDGPGFAGATEKYKDKTFASMARLGYTVEEVRQVMAGNFLAVTGLDQRSSFKLAPLRAEDTAPSDLKPDINPGHDH